MTSQKVSLFHTSVAKAFNEGRVGGVGVLYSVGHFGEAEGRCWGMELKDQINAIFLSSQAHSTTRYFCQKKHTRLLPGLMHYI